MNPPDEKYDRPLSETQPGLVKSMQLNKYPLALYISTEDVSTIVRLLSVSQRLSLI